MNPALSNLALLLARIMLAVIFILSGYGKLKGYIGDADTYARTTGYMQSAGIPGSLLPLVIAAELGGGILILFGFLTRLMALALCIFTLAAAILFHFKPDDMAQMTNFLKNVAISGGFLALVASGAGAISIDGLINRRSYD